MSATNRVKRSPAEVVREYGPFEGKPAIHGVTFDGEQIWCAVGDAVLAVEPASGAVARRLPVAAHAGTAYDGRYLWQLADDRIHKIDPATGEVVASVPAPGGGGSGLAWAEGCLWVGQYRARTIVQIDPGTGAVLRTIQSERFVTGVSWLDGELWHGTAEAERSDLRRVDAASGEVLEILDMPAGTMVSGLEHGADGVAYCGGGTSGVVRAVRTTRRGASSRK
jgi:glutamine cyclotransferase